MATSGVSVRVSDRTGAVIVLVLALIFVLPYLLCTLRNQMVGKGKPGWVPGALWPDVLQPQECTLWPFGNGNKQGAPVEEGRGYTPLPLPPAPGQPAPVLPAPTPAPAPQPKATCYSPEVVCAGFRLGVSRISAGVRCDYVQCRNGYLYDLDSDQGRRSLAQVHERGVFVGWNWP